MNQLELHDLVIAAANGDRNAFATLIRRTEGSIRTYILGRVRDPDWADDLAQEAFVAAFQGLGALREPDKFGPWLFGIAENIVSFWIRRTVRHREFITYMPLPDGDSLEGYSSSESARTDTRRIIASLAHLSPKNAQAVVLYHGEGLSQRECAAFLGISHKAFESRITRAREHMKRENRVMSTDDYASGSPESFDHRVREEIDRLAAVLGSTSRKEPTDAAEERLHVLFARNGERLDRFIAEATSPEERRAAVRMTLSLGHSGIGRALTLATSDDCDIRRNALAAIPWPFEGIWTEGTHVYEVIETLHAADFNDAQKIDLLIDIIRRPTALRELLPKRDIKAIAGDSPIYIEMLLRYGKRAIGRLNELLVVDVAENREPDPWLMKALIAFGTEGVSALLPRSTTHSPELVLAIKASRALGEAKDAFWRYVSSSHWRYIDDRNVPIINRLHVSSHFVQPSRIPDTEYRKIGSWLSSCLTDPSLETETRAAVVDALGYYPDTVAHAPLVGTVFGVDEAMSAEAARSLGKLPSAARVEPLLRALETSSFPVKLVAYQALVRLLTSYAESVTTLRKRTTEELPCSFQNELCAVESLLSELTKYQERIEKKRKDLAENLAIPNHRRKLVSDSGIWSHLLRNLQNDVLPVKDRRVLEDENILRPKSMFSKHLQEAQKDDGAQTNQHGYSDQHRIPTPLLDVHLGTIVRELPDDRRYTEQKIKAASARVNSRYDIAIRRLYEEWWMHRNGREYWFTERGRIAWRIEHLLCESAVSHQG